VSHPTGPTRSARRAAPLVLALGIGLVSGCSSDDATGTANAAPASSAEASTSAAEPASPSSSAPASSSAAEAESETVTATEGEMFIELSEDSFSPGTYTIEVTNTGNMAHDLVLERDGEDVTGTDVIRPGQSATLEVTLEEGDYVFYCSVGAHRAAGMELPVTVSA
jgi:plastocyanin